MNAQTRGGEAAPPDRCDAYKSDGKAEGLLFVKGSCLVWFDRLPIDEEKSRVLDCTP